MPDERWTEAVQQRDAMEALLNNKGWKMLYEVFQQKEDILLADLLDPGKEFSDISLREIRMALINIRVMIVTPEAMLLDAQERIKEFADLDKAAADVETEADDLEPEEGAAP